MWLQCSETVCTKYGTDYEKYCISGIVHLNNLPNVRAQDHPSFRKDQRAIENRLARDEWDPTLERNRLTARITVSTWLSVARHPSVPLQDGREYPVLVIPGDAEIFIDKGEVLLAVLKYKAAHASCEPPLGSQRSSAGWCVVDVLLDGKYRGLTDISRVLKSRDRFFRTKSAKVEQGRSISGRFEGGGQLQI